MDVVVVPEGFSFQVSLLCPEEEEAYSSYISVIVSPADAARLRDFLFDNRNI